MNLLYDFFHSWFVAAWGCAGTLAIVTAWWLTRDVSAPRRRDFWRSFVIAVSFAPTILPVQAEFVSGIVMPASWALFLAVRDLSGIALFAGLLPVVLVTAVFWEVQLTFRLLRKRTPNQAAPHESRPAGGIGEPRR